MKKYIGYVVTLGLFVFPVITFAVSESSISVSNNYANYSIEKLEALIAQLQKQLAELKKNQVTCNIAEIDLSLGDGEDTTQKEYVKGVQTFLKEKGHFTYSATGYFGKITRAALIAFQKTAGLEQSGELDKATRAYVRTLKCQKNYFIEKKEVEKKTEVKNTGLVISSIILKNDGKKLIWSANGYSKGGYKIVWSKNITPTYPTRDGDQYIYLTDPNATSANIEAFIGSGIYYARVCEYLDGVCKIYSNEIQVSL